MRVLRFVIIAILLLDWTALADEVSTLPKKITATSDAVAASGRWALTTRLSAPLLPRINSVEIVCNRTRGTCQEAVASLYTKEDVPQLTRPFLTVSISEYKVTRWDASSITAISAKPVADLEIQIDLQDGTATRRYQETKARGSQTANPSRIVRWELK
jgi:hypothetical protein